MIYWYRCQLLIIERGDVILDYANVPKLNLEELRKRGGNPHVLYLASLYESGEARLVLDGNVDDPKCFFKINKEKAEPPEWRCLPFGSGASLSVLSDKEDAAATITYYPDTGFSIVSVPAKMVDTLGRRLGVFANVQALWGCGA